jgi:hypothetical protein
MEEDTDELTEEVAIARAESMLVQHIQVNLFQGKM